MSNDSIETVESLRKVIANQRFELKKKNQEVSVLNERLHDLRCALRLISVSTRNRDIVTAMEHFFSKGSNLSELHRRIERLEAANSSLVCEKSDLRNQLYRIVKKLGCEHDMHAGENGELECLWKLANEIETLRLTVETLSK